MNLNSYPNRLPKVLTLGWTILGIKIQKFCQNVSHLARSVSKLKPRKKIKISFAECDIQIVYRSTIRSREAKSEQIDN